ncbi:hypothetical protein diail_4913, partial [Diaporthe ilicicola]
MKTTAVFAAALACASNALAQTVEYYKLVAYAPDETFDGEDLKPLGRYWRIGVQANSSCGDVAPAVAFFGGAIAVYNDGTSNQQYAYIDFSGTADGLMALTPADSTGGAPKDPFSVMGAEQDEIYLYYNGADLADSQWLACPGETEDEFWVYPEKAYAKSMGRDQCTEFRVRAQQVPQPT